MQAAGFLLHIYLTISFKASNTLLNSAEYTPTRERVFLLPCLKILLGHSNRWTQCNQVVEYAPAERAEQLLMFYLYPCLLCGLMHPSTPSSPYFSADSSI
jgi:hypothetical protein